MTDLQLGPIGQISRSVLDVPAAEAWYRDVLGLKHLYTFGTLAFFQCGETRLMLTSGEGGEAPPADQYIIYFRVADIQAAHAELGRRGAVFEGAPHLIHRHQDGTEEWMAFLRDNEQRLIGLMAQVKPDGS